MQQERDGVVAEKKQLEEEKDIQMRVVVFKADGLAAGDVEAGTSDAYVKLRLSDTSKTTDLRAVDIRTWSAKHGDTAGAQAVGANPDDEACIMPPLFAAEAKRWLLVDYPQRLTNPKLIRVM